MNHEPRKNAMSEIQFGESATVPHKREPLRGLNIIADILFTCGFLVIFSIFAIPFLVPWEIRHVLLPLLVVVCPLLGLVFIVISIAVSKMHEGLLERSNKIDELEKRISELNDMLAKQS